MQSNMRILFFGHKGWISSYFIPILRDAGHDVICAANVRAEDREEVRILLNTVAPDRVVAFIGRTHGGDINTIDYLEQPGKLVENVRDNLYAPMMLAIMCKVRGIHFTYLGTGCIFSDEDPLSVKHTEADAPNFFGSAYSTVKGFTDQLMQEYDNVLNVRIRMPITPDRHPRNFITKIVSYEKICSMPNSMTVLHTLLPILLDMINRGQTGTINLVNPGVMSHNEILEMYRDIVDADKTWTNFSVEDQNRLLASKRSNNQLDTTLLESLYPDVPTLRDAVAECLARIKKNI